MSYLGIGEEGRIVSCQYHRPLLPQQDIPDGVLEDVADDLVVEGTEGGVQDDDGGGAVETPGQADPLSLSSRHQNSSNKSPLFIIQFEKKVHLKIRFSFKIRL